MPPTKVFHLPGCWKMGQRAWLNVLLGLCSGTMAHSHNQMSMSSWLRTLCLSWWMGQGRLMGFIDHSATHFLMSGGQASSMGNANVLAVCF